MKFAFLPGSGNNAPGALIPTPAPHAVKDVIAVRLAVINKGAKRKNLLPEGCFRQLLCGGFQKPHLASEGLVGDLERLKLLPT